MKRDFHYKIEDLDKALKKEDSGKLLKSNRCDKHIDEDEIA